MTTPKPPPPLPPVPPEGMGYTVHATRIALRERPGDGARFLSVICGSFLTALMGSRAGQLPIMRQHGAVLRVPVTVAGIALGAGVGKYVSPFALMIGYRIGKAVTTLPGAVISDLTGQSHSETIHPQEAAHLQYEGSGDEFIDDAVGQMYLCEKQKPSSASLGSSLSNWFWSEDAYLQCRWINGKYISTPKIQESLVWERFYSEEASRYYICNRDSGECRWEAYSLGA
eukprot:gb/GECH01014276.1/.p1 GENE.gb/GECH01014276.1/~~gb/GECH01014276.1/.p1  ORF type:complete len:228 (+),score=39.32 gb/GECH01014276.1/:1-684(+)